HHILFSRPVASFLPKLLETFIVFSARDHTLIVSEDLSSADGPWFASIKRSSLAVMALKPTQRICG
ncbi:MAG TPA: hypothetical protein PLV15_08770, partial [Smithella sp.]|nr:hypothetical protein [Smithella sp.]